MSYIEIIEKYNLPLSVEIAEDNTAEILDKQENVLFTGSGDNEFIKKMVEEINGLEEQVLMTWHDSENERFQQIEQDINQVLIKHKKSIKDNHTP